MVDASATARKKSYDTASAYLLILDQIRNWLDDALPQVSPSSATGKALSYLHNEWDQLTRYLDDGRLEIDNNGAENAIRLFVLSIFGK